MVASFAKYLFEFHTWWLYGWICHLLAIWISGLGYKWQGVCVFHWYLRRKSFQTSACQCFSATQHSSFQSSKRRCASRLEYRSMPCWSWSLAHWQSCSSEAPWSRQRCTCHASKSTHSESVGSSVNFGRLPSGTSIDLGFAIWELREGEKRTKLSP